MRAILVSFCLFVSVHVSQAASVSHQVPYYGEKFYSDLSSGLSNTKLRDALRSVLESYHQAKSGDFDTISNSCGGKNCYTHVSLGYDLARIHLMGSISLINHNDGTYAVHDVYCDVDKDERDFKGGQSPGPNRVPDASVLNTEHTWPQSRFGGRFGKNMQKSDLHHLYPADNQMNSIRGNNPFGEVQNNEKPLKCSASRFGKSVASRGVEVFEPPRNHRGNVARALFYFSVRYEMPIDSAQETVLRKWHQEDPIDEEETYRNEAIHRVQGNRNPFIDHPEFVDMIADF